MAIFIHNGTICSIPTLSRKSLTLPKILVPLHRLNPHTSPHLTTPSHKKGPSHRGPFLFFRFRQNLSLQHGIE
ncbi:hypothetical protein [Rubritalea tangerina]|uniref:hypothetical protein n=1 Tax=Rubritalea tangerina TaxID=430798 RepID=UPI0036117E39